jgi:PAS domain S-box-containing protein
LLPIKFESFFNASSDLILILSPEKRILRANSSCLVFLGVTADLVEGKRFSDFTPESDRSRLAQFFGGLESARSSSNSIRIRFSHQGSFDHWVEWVLCKDASNFICIGRDVTEQVEKELFSEQIQKTAKVGGFRVDIKTGTVHWTDEVYDINELPRGTPVSLERALEFYPPDSRAVVERLLQASMAEGKPFEFELPFITAKGNKRWGRATGFPVQEAGVVFEVYGAFQDITERKRLSMNNETLVYCSDLGMWEWDLQSNSVFYDDRWCEMIGYRREELRPHFDTWAQLCHPDDRARSEKAFTGYLEGSIPFYEVKFRMKHKKGHWVPILSKGKITQRGANGKPIIFSGAHVDFSRFQRLEDDLEVQHVIAQQSAKLAQIGELASGVGHEINNPLTVVLFHLDKIERRLRSQNILSSEIEESLRKQKLAVDRIRKIVDSLRVISRRSVASEDRMDLVEAVRQTQSLMSEIYEAEGIHLEVLLPQVSVMIAGSAGHVHQILMNLLSNSRDAVAGRSRPEIRVEVLTENRTAILRVTDNGKGIPQETQKRILEPFFTTKEIGKGTGLGLSITLALVRELHAEIRFESREESGAMFEVLIPLAGEQRQSLEKRVLVVDDEEDIRNILEGTLTDAGFKVNLASNGAEALNQIHATKFDAIVTDLKMPKMTGFELIRKLRDMPDESIPAIVLMTGGVSYAKESKQLEELSQSVNAYIEKPFRPDDIYRAVKEAIKKREPI